MSATTSSAFAIAFTALLGAPVAAPVIARLAMRLPKALQTHAYLALAGLPLAVAAMSCGGLSSPIYQVNAVAVLAAFWAFLALAVSAFRFGSRWLRYTLGPLSILLLALSLFAGTLGGLGTVFIVGDTVPVFTHLGNPTPFTPAQLRVLARFPVTTIEKYMGPFPLEGGRGEEDNVGAVADAVKAINPKSKVLMYVNSQFAYRKCVGGYACGGDRCVGECVDACTNKNK